MFIRIIFRSNVKSIKYFHFNKVFSIKFMCFDRLALCSADAYNDLAQRTSPQ